MPATFILSFDCEGKWGVADLLATEHARQLSDERLIEGYRAILRLLDEYDVAATFAFVGAFAQTRSAYARIAPALEQMASRYPDYLGPAVRDIEQSAGDGWHGDHLVELVCDSPVGHEIALHGVTHVPWTAMDRHGLDTEMSLFKSLEGPVGQSRTFVYPRNLVAHSEALAEHGFAGFRSARPQRSRARSLLSEFNLLAAPDHPDAGAGIVAIPAGYFLNWRHGVRRLVPPAVTAMRARRLLGEAARSGGIVHYWLHPENVVSAPATLPLLGSLLREVAHAREAGRCEVHTQLAYCREQQSLR